MKKVILCAVVIVAAITTTIVSCDSPAAGNAKVITKDSSWFVKRGEYLVNSVGCDDCHSPKTMGPKGPEIIAELRLSGYPSSRPIAAVNTNEIKKGWAMFGPDLTNGAGPWGMSFAANLTSDETGIGNWSQAQFINSIRKGKFKGMDNGRDLLPPMPWYIYKNMTDEDLKSIYYFLKTTKPVENVVPAPKPFDTL